MADVVITASAVLQSTGAQTADGIAGATITAGQTLYEDATDGNSLKLADANASAATATVKGIALHGALDGQPIKYQGAGDIAIGGTLVPGKIYVQSATAGFIADSADLATGHRTTIIGVAKTAAILTMKLYNSGVTV